VSQEKKPVFAYFGHHKCASTYVNQIVDDVCTNLGLKNRIEYLPQILAFDYHEKEPHKQILKDLLTSLENDDYNFVCHGNADRSLLNTLDKRGYKGFHVIRDPRDVVVSGYFSHKNSHPARADFNPWLLDHREALNAVDQDKGFSLEMEFCETYFERLRNWDFSNPKVYESKFEELTVSPKKEFTKIFDFLGLEVDNSSFSTILSFVINKVLKKALNRPMPHSSILPEFVFNRALGLNSFERHSKGRKKGQEDNASHFRKGVAGDWVNYFTPAIKKEFKDRYNDVVIKLGYESNSDW